MRVSPDQGNGLAHARRSQPWHTHSFRRSVADSTGRSWPPSRPAGACTRPEVSGWPRLTSAVCGEYARKLSGGQAFLLVTALSPKDCKSIAKASKVRILHLPPSVREGL